jgi:hypothetical protein
LTNTQVATKVTMKRAEAIRRIKTAARSRALVFTDHAYDRLDLLGETVESLSIAVERARSFVEQEQEDDTWRVFGDGLTCVLALVDDVVVVTLFA